MADAKIRAVITAKDEASSVLKSFGGVAGSLGGALANVAKVAAVGLVAAGTAAVGFGALSVKAYSESENELTQLNAVLKSTGGIAGFTADQAIKLSQALQKTTKFSDEEVLSAENLLLTFTSIGKDIMPQATETVLDMATALGEDTKSASIQLGKALQDPVLGITALRRVGVNFSDSQKDVIKNLVDTGQKAEAQRLILKELNTEFGGSAKAAGDTFAGSLAKIKNNLNDVQETIGKTIVKAITPFVQKAAEFANAIDWNDVIKNATTLLRLLWDTFTLGDPTLKKGEEAFSGVAKVLTHVAEFLWAVKDAMVNAINFLRPSFEALWSTIKTSMPQLKEYWNDVLKPLAIALGVTVVAAVWLLVNALNISFKIWKAQIDIIEGVRAGLVNAWHEINSTWQKAVAFFQDLWAGIIRGATEATTIMMNIFKPVADFISFQLQTIYAVAMWVWHGIYNNAVKPTADWIVAKLTELGTFVAGVWQGILNFARPIWQEISNIAVAAWGRISAIWGGVAGWFASIFGSVSGSGQKAASSIGGFFSGIWEDIKSGARSALNWVIDKMNSAIKAYNNTIGKIPNAPHISEVQQLASGTNFAQGGRTLVGEQGAEIVDLPRGSRVYPSGVSPSTGGTPVNITINAGAYMGSRQDARTYAKMIADALKDYAAMNGQSTGQVLGI